MRVFARNVIEFCTVFVHSCMCSYVLGGMYWWASNLNILVKVKISQDEKIVQLLVKVFFIPAFTKV